MALAKICGLSSRETMEAALDGGAAFVGLMFFAASPRVISIAEATALAGLARGRAQVVAVTVDPDDVLVERLASGLRPDFIQLHGRESPARAREIGDKAGVGVIKVIQVSSADDLVRAATFEDAAEHLMFDAQAPADSRRPGGHGQAFDWSLLAERRFRRPWFLAGGLDADNVTAAIGASGAPMVDVSSGVEDGAGLKDPALITRFLDAARRA